MSVEKNIGNSSPPHAAQSQLGRFDMGDVKQGGVGSEGRNRRSLDHIDIGDVHIFGDDKGGGAHDGRSQLAVRTGRNFNGRRLFGRIAHFLHQGNGEGSGGDDIGDGGTRYQAGQAAAEDSRLGRSALKPPSILKASRIKYSPAPALSSMAPNRTNRKTMVAETSSGMP